MDNGITEFGAYDGQAEAARRLHRPVAGGFELPFVRTACDATRGFIEIKDGTAAHQPLRHGHATTRSPPR